MLVLGLSVVAGCEAEPVEEVDSVGQEAQSSPNEAVIANFFPGTNNLSGNFSGAGNYDRMGDSVRITLDQVTIDQLAMCRCNVICPIAGMTVFHSTCCVNPSYVPPDACAP